MLYVIIGLIVVGSIGLALYTVIRKSELKAQLSSLMAVLEEQESSYVSEVNRLKNELSRCEQIRHIPNILERSRVLEAEIAQQLGQAQKEADEIVLLAHRDIERMKERNAAKQEEAQLRANTIIQEATQEASRLKKNLIREAQEDAAKAKEALQVANSHANGLYEHAEKEARKIASEARKVAKEKAQNAEQNLSAAIEFAFKIRNDAEMRAQQIAGSAYEAMKKQEFYEAAAEALKNTIEGYRGVFRVPSDHILDELAEEYGFAKSGERLKIARERTRLMERNGAAATCNYPEGWKRDYAINFVLAAFNGKVDSILARLKPANQGKLIQEIKDVYALANHDGEVFKNARIHPEYLEARLEELKWAVAVQRLKEKEREEQRAIREQMREEEKARREYERARKQTEQEEQTLARAIERARQEYNEASSQDRAKYEARLQELAEKLRQAEEKNQRAISMAQQTKAGHVYVISNIGSFGEDVYKIGLTRRLEPLDRVRELGDASVPFPFDVHAMIFSADAPALEAALHRCFLQNQVNKLNRRKEFFRLKLQDIRKVIDDLNLVVKWTMTAEATHYRESLTLERQMLDDPEFRKRWTDAEAAYEAKTPFDDDTEEALEEDECSNADAVSN
jgi:membrane protein involved in colicin uptake